MINNSTDQRPSEDGYELWLRYSASSPTTDLAEAELALGVESLLGNSIPVIPRISRPGALVIGATR